VSTAVSSTAVGTAASIPGSAFVEHVVEADGFTVRYMESGSGETLLVLHGGGGIEFNPAHDLLAGQFRVVVIEMPGFGAAENTRTQNLKELADTVVKIADAIGLEKFRLLGTSYGGATALWVAVRHPDRVSHLVLEVPAAFRTSAPKPHDLSPEQFMKAFHAHPERKPWLRAPDPVAMGRRIAFMDRTIGPEHDQELENLLPDMMVPTLVLFGTKDGLFGTDNGRTYARLIPQCSFQIVYDAAHDLSGDRPEAFADTVTDFLNRGMGYNVTHRTTLLNP
jgi:pimeloyl-ACP methyl ester carboxylesterase